MMTSELQAAAAEIELKESTGCVFLDMKACPVDDLKAQLEAERAKVKELEDKIKKLRESLEFYAKSNNIAEYGKPNTDGVWNHFQTLGGSGISVECGGVALAALEDDR